jgi:YgiT-type zinc finger domain-containing protein
MSNKNKRVCCDFCGSDAAQIKLVTRSYGKGENLLLIENVPAVVCPKCGESYLTAETLHEIARIKLHRKSFAKKRNVAVAEFV